MNYKILFTSLLVSATVTSFAQQPYQGKIGKTFDESKEWWPTPTTAPKDAPNIIWILIDDVGFGASSTFGGVIPTPIFDSLANNGLRYTNFHTTAICAPTRAALLTGRNSGTVHMSGFAHYWGSAGFPGWDGYIPEKTGTVAEILKQAGYTTFAVGKYGVTPDAEATNAGPFDHWPSGKGFEHFFGFLGSETDQYKPVLVEDNAFITPDGRHLSEQITDKAIRYIDKTKKANPDKPFFLYYAPGATHAPHQVPDDWRDIYKGKFDDGWDAFRQKVFDNQKKLGIIPSYAQLPERNPLVKAWNDLPKDEQKLYARFMEVYAAYLTYTDYQVGRVINELKQINQLDNTLIFVLIGDNGASKEGNDNGVVEKRWGPRYDKTITQEAYIKKNEAAIERIGTPETEPNYPLGWAQAANTPFKYWKQDAFAEGGTHNPLIVFYPKKITDKGTIRTQFSHVNDILPTTLEAIGIKPPAAIRGIKQDSLQGTSLVYTFNNAGAPTRHTTQYFYIFGSRSIYNNGWKAAAAHHPDAIDLASFNKPVPKSDYNKDEWLLYNLNEDFNERINLAEKNPKKLAELKALLDKELQKNNVYPLINWEDVYQQKFINSKKAATFKAPPPPPGQKNDGK
ncbi:MAG: sulfatase-like hydrolase/transferase [Agriterribacter sp.]